MINPKNIGISAAIGFFLSFFIGLFSDVRFSHVLLRALIFGAVFAVLCVGISFLYHRFLSVDSSSFGSDGEPSVQKSAGGIVNIVVDDSELPDDGMTPKFTVLDNSGLVDKRELSPADEVDEPVAEEPAAQIIPAPEVPLSDIVPKAQKAESGSASAPAAEGAVPFTPAALDSVAKTASPAAESPAPAGKSAPAAEPVSSEAKTAALDELPDMGEMEAASAGAGTASELSVVEEVVTDTDFSTGGAHLKEQPISGDTNVMAKAIQTLLAKDN